MPEPGRCLRPAALAAALLVTAGCLFDTEEVNHLPVINSLSHAPPEVLPDSLVTVSVEAGDPDGDPLSFEWSASAGSFPGDATERSVLWRAPGVARSCTLAVSVDDGKGAVAANHLIEVSEYPPLMILSADTLSFPIDVSVRQLTVTNSGGSALAWTTGTSHPWLSVSPDSGVTPQSQELEVKVDRTGLPDGVFRGVVDFSSNGGADSVEVTMMVEADPVLRLSPWPLEFGLVLRELPLEITNEGTGILEWSLAVDVPWASVTPPAGATTDERDTVRVNVDRTSLPAGEGYGILTVTSNGGASQRVLRIHSAEEPVWTYRVVTVYPHDPDAFTQGLIYHDGVLYESTGRYGASTLRRVNLETGKPQQMVALDRRYFGEGLALWDDRLIQLTWRRRTAFVYDRETFASRGEFSYPTEGWGLTQNATRLIMSDGTSTLYFRDPDTFVGSGSVTVTDSRGPRNRLNELEWIEGEVWANVWHMDFIARIDPETG